MPHFLIHITQISSTNKTEIWTKKKVILEDMQVFKYLKF